MVGSPVIGAFIAFWGFWVLLAIGFIRDELGLRGATIFLLLWLIGLVGLPYVPYGAARDMFTSWVAVLDIALVLKILRGDIRLT